MINYIRKLLYLPQTEKTEKIREGLEIVFGENIGLLPESMNSEQVGRIEFYVEIPCSEGG